MTLHIGFATEFFTLWERRAEQHYKTSTDGMQYLAHTVYDYYFLQNLSKDQAAAQEKAAARGCTELEPDFQLFGQRWNFSVTVRENQPVQPPTRFQTDIYGMYGTDIAAYDYSTEHYKRGGEIKLPGISALWVEYLHAYNTERTHTFNELRRAVICRAKLTELGILIKVGREYLTPGKAERKAKAAIVAAAAQGHHYENGKRMALEIKEIDSFSFDGNFGTTFIKTYVSNDGKLFKYMGGTPPEISREDFTPVKATIKHDNYRDVMETKLQRIK
jgi:co-chaperonin GroES (HSP10)